MLSVCGECQRRKNGSDCGTRKACSDWETDGGEKQAEKLGRKKYDIQVSKNAKSVDAEINEANGHSEFGREIKSVPRAFD
jgi:hypothetical protein